MYGDLTRILWFLTLGDLCPGGCVSSVNVDYQINPKNFISVRSQYPDDIEGQRTGFKTKYTERTISWNHWLDSTLVFRPELRCDRSCETPAFNNGTKKGQMMFAAGMTFFC